MAAMVAGGGTPFESFPAPSSAEESYPPFDKQRADYSLYLVTDSTPKILPVGKSVCDVVEAALCGDSSGGGGGGAGGVTCVQYREKHADTGAMIATARELHAITRKYGRPLLINDRVDVALAVGCEGVHIGQDDIGEYKYIFFSLGRLRIYCWCGGSEWLAPCCSPRVRLGLTCGLCVDVQTARKLLGEDKIIGVTVSNAEEVEAAVRGGADYLGIGTVFATTT